MNFVIVSFRAESKYWHDASMKLMNNARPKRIKLTIEQQQKLMNVVREGLFKSILCQDGRRGLYMLSLVHREEA